MIARLTPLKRSDRVKPRNAKRRQSEFGRAYGSKARVAFVASLACVCCGKVGHSENAHIETGGAGRKADYTKIIPLCSQRSDYGSYGCHRRLHNLGIKTFEHRHGLDLHAEAALLNERWLAHSRTAAVPEPS